MNNQNTESQKNQKKSKQLAAYGSWKSSITAELMTSKAVGLTEPKILGDRIFWLEYRPQESGRCTIVDYNHGNPISLIPVEFNVRSTVHEYGGAAWAVGNTAIYFVNLKDQRIYSVDIEDRSTAKPIVKPSDRCYADLQYCASRNSLIAVIEDHTDKSKEPVASIVEINCATLTEHCLVKGADFYSNPRLSPDDKELIWLQWFHPNMPWTENELWQATMPAETDVQQPLLTGTKLVGNKEAVFQPQWSPSGDIYYVSDRSNWWNLYRYWRKSEDQCISAVEKECGLPLWQFGISTWGFLSSTKALVAYVDKGIWSLYIVGLKTGKSQAIQSTYNSFSHIATDANTGRALVIAADGTSVDQLCEIEEQSGGQSIEPLYQDGEISMPVGSISSALPIHFDTTHFEQAYGFFYPPLNAEYTGAANEKPPLIVICHGGPTGATNAALNIKIQFWTSRGFAVADINYRGSTGFGREYRLRLNSNWGIYDVDDACAAAEYCVDQGWVDREKLIIRGSSAGGYTVLSALCFRETFSAGCSLYGIGDLNTLASDTHKFESRYTDTLIAPASETKIYNARSPIKHIERFSCPTIFFQGMQDKVVPPEQAKSMASALDQAGFPVSLITYENESHGFRQANNIVHAFNAELAFYGAVFKIETDSIITDLEIANINSTRNRLR